MRWPGACVSAAKEACQPDLAPPDPRLTPGRRRARRSQPRPTPDPRSPPGRAGASARRHRAAVRCGTNGERAEHRRPVRSARERRHEHVDASEVAHHDLTHAPHHDFRDARHRAPPIPSYSRLLARALAFAPLVALPRSLLPDPHARTRSHHACRRPASGLPPSRLGWPARCLFGRSRKGGPARQRWTPLPRKPRREAKSEPEAGRRPVDLLGSTPRDQRPQINGRPSSLGTFAFTRKERSPP